MTTFNRESIHGQYFLYQRGVVSTTTPWGRPTYEKLKTFLTYIQTNTSILTDYDVYIMGGVLFDFNTTWDVDICLVGGSQTNEKIEEDLNYLTDLALNTYNLLVDVSWYESRPKNLTYSEMEESNFFQQDVNHKKIGYVKKQIGDDIQESDLRTYSDATLLTEHLIQRNYGIIKHTDKMINKVQNNPNPITITTFSVNEFLETDENHFLNNTNR
jgi:signal recognition particle GTPase